MLIRFLITSFLIKVAFIASTNQTVLDEATGQCGGQPVDVVFALDASNSIYILDFKKQLDFVSNMVEKFNIVPDGTWVGVETFGSEVRIIAELGEIMDAERLKGKIKGIKRQNEGYYTNTHLALTHLRAMFSRSFVRPGTSRVAIVITDGESSQPLLTKLAADEVHALDIVVYAIGVGRMINVHELEKIASQRDFVFMVDSYDDLHSILSNMTSKTCPRPIVEETETPEPDTPKPITWPQPATTKPWPSPEPGERPTPCVCPQQPFQTAVPTPTPTELPISPKSTEGCDRSLVFNVYFCIPDQLSTVDTYRALQFIRDVTGALNETPASINLHLCPRICHTTFPRPPLECTDLFNQINFITDLDSRQSEAVTRNDLQLQYIRKQEEGYRRRYPLEDPDKRSAVAVLMVDNSLKNMDDMLREVDYARENGLQILTIGVGDYVDRGDLWKVATSEKDLLYLRSYNHLPTIRNTLLERVCFRGLVRPSEKSFQLD